MLIKLGELIQLGASNIQSANSVFSDPEINVRFEKFAKELKRIAPKADDFLYFSTVVMHAAERALINDDGSPKLDRVGNPLTANWEKIGEGIKWACSDPNIFAYANNNRDIFPEDELIKAHKQFIGRPICVDHRSSQVDGVRGIILDAYYDRPFKRVIALAAIDKKSYPELARKIATGVSTSVSMGTAVGNCCCSDCGTVARTEKDFCHHMRNKTCRGEINRELSPIEISIVVSPADQNAKIRTIFAAAQDLKVRKYSSDTAEKITELEADLKQANEKLSELKGILEDETDPSAPTAPYGQGGDLNPPQDTTNTQSTTLNTPTRYAMNIEALFAELNILKSAMEKTLNQLTQKQEEIMSDQEKTNKKEAYWLGGGGVNEPTPGKVKYPIDPLADNLREKEDKQMVGQSPFPGVGDVEGLHPSPASADQKNELERKKLIQRAELDQRMLRRKEALEKAKANLKSEGYWLGGGGVNEPTPGKVKYPIDPLDHQARMEDKPMVGQKPFPDVGDVEGLHPSPASVDQKDELERKKMLARASLKARFVRAANTDGTDNYGDSGWQIFAKDENGEKLVFSATVKELTGKNSEALFDVVATKDFGAKMLEKIRAHGLTKAASMFKAGQDAGHAPEGPGGQPGMPMDMGGAGPAPTMDAAPAMPASEPTPEDKGGTGDPKESALKLAETVRDNASDLLEAVRLLTGDQAEMGDLEKGIQALPKAATDAVIVPAAKMRRNIHQMILSAAKKSLAELKEHHSELKLIAEMADKETVKNASIRSMIAQAFIEAEAANMDAHGILRSYAAYEKGVDGLQIRVKQATEMSASEKEDKDESCSADDGTVDENAAADDLLSTDENEADDLNLHYDPTGGPHDEGFNLDDFEDELGSDHEEGHDEMGEDLLPEGDETMAADDVNEMNDQGTLVKLPPGAPVPPGAEAVQTKAASFDLTTKEGRTAYRAKLAKDVNEGNHNTDPQDVSKIKWHPLLQEANRLANGQTQLDTKPSDALGLVETLPENQKRMMEVAKVAPKVRTAAETLNNLIKEGAVDKANLDQLVAEGLDPAVVKYWREFYGEGDKTSSEFGKLLTTEEMKAAAAEEMATYRVKIARSYDLANEMVRRGLLADDRASIERQVNEAMNWNDAAYESMKRVIAKQNVSGVRKEASVPQVGLIGSGDPYTNSSTTSDLDLQAQLDNAFSGRRY
jgi:hypothetical protein